VPDIIPTISVVIPLYNKERYIQRTLDSVLAQTFQDFEVVVVNDGSTDNGPAVVREYHDPRVRLIDQENQGVSAARNRGIREAHGQLVAFLDADDEWKSTFLETIKNLLADYPSAGLYTTGYSVVNLNCRERDARFRTIGSGYRGVVRNYFVDAYHDCVVTSNTAVIPKRVFEMVGFFDEGIRFGEDLLMWYKVALNYDIVIDNSVNAVYYHDAAGRSSFQKKGSNIEFFRAMGKYIHFPTDNMSSDKKKWAERYYRHMIYTKCINLARKGEWLELLNLAWHLLNA